MSNQQASIHDDDVTTQIRAVVNDCSRRRAAGEALADDEVMAAHPDLMPSLGEELRLITAAREGVSRPSDADTCADHHSDTGSGYLEVRCPNCHTSMEVAADTQLTDLSCSACGIHFSLVDQSKATRTAPPLSKLGRFELIERLGVGGFGSVWKARDKELDRTVAIKIPRAAGMTADEQERFFREARAAAQLHHPNIVSVHEVGRDGDLVYIVSDFVRGVTLGDWLTGQRLTSREAAELCAKIADALHHAHENGVVHRDLKPANVMIDGDGQPHLVDFGLARRNVGDVTVTMDGQVLGTPAYMSPELAQGTAHTADRRSDVYSLGVLLFQLLTGELPFRGNPQMLVHQVINDEPPSPRKLNANVPKDLETIVLKSLEKEPARRYQTAHALAGDLRHFLAGEAIQARPVGRLERTWRWCKRKPVPALLSAALLSILVMISVVAPIVAWHQATLRSQAEIARANEAKLRLRAEAEEKKANIESAKSRQVARFLTDMIRSVGPYVASGRNTTLLREILDTTSERLDRDLKDQPDVEADVLDTIGQGYDALGEYEKAEMMHRKALATRKQLLGDEHPDVAASLDHLAIVLYRQWKLDEAEMLHRQALAMRKKLLGEEHPDVAASLNDLALVLGRENKLSEAETMFRQALAIQKSYLGDESPDLAVSLNNLANVLELEGELAEAETVQRKALAMRKKQLGDEHPEVANFLICLGDLLQHESKLEESEQVYRQALEICKKHLHEDPDNLVSRRCLEYVWRSLATLHATGGDWQAAAKAFASAKEQDPGDPYAYYYLAVAHLAAGDTVGYHSVCEEMLGRFAKTTNPYVAERIGYACVPAPQAVQDMPQLVTAAKLGATLSNGNSRLVGAALYRTGKFQDALAQFEATGRNGFQFNAWDGAFLAMIQYRLGNTAEATRRLDQARQKSDVAEGWWEKVEVDHLIREADNLIVSGPQPAAAQP
jgi:tetratricopeptide (TPR) repeat protein